MRIIAGEHRGRRLEAPPGEGTRPITDRAKQSLFDVLSPYLEGAVVADVFAGTGSMGLECLSRGAAVAHFFEADRGVVAALKRNVAMLREEGRSRVHAGDLFEVLPRAIAAGTTEPLNVVFLDPPYRFLAEKPEALRRLVATLAEGGRLAPGAVVSFRHDVADRLDLPPLRTVRELRYGSMLIELMAM